KAYVSEAARHVAGDAIQVHGGIGFTWEYDLHLYFKRAKALEPLYGDTEFHRELIARHVTAWGSRHDRPTAGHHGRRSPFVHPRLVRRDDVGRSRRARDQSRVARR